MNAELEVRELKEAEACTAYDFYREAEKLLTQRDAVAAAPLLRQAAGQLPGERGIERLLALALYGSSLFGEAEPVLRRLVEASPLDADVRHLLAQTLVELDRAEEAQAHFALAGRLEPAYAVSCRTWGGGRAGPPDRNGVG
jgi:Flp pilus assembly protein TadD